MTEDVNTPMSGDETAPLSIKDVLKITNYRQLWFGQIISVFGDSLTNFGLVLLVNLITQGSAASIAGLLIAIGLPKATIGLIAGVLVDRFSRRRVMILSNVMSGAMVCCFILYAVMGWQNIWFLYAVAFINSTIDSFFMPARSAITPNLVPPHGLMAANSLGQISMVLFRVIGTAAAGFIIGVFDAYWAVFTLDVITFLFAAFFISRIVLEEKTQKTTGNTAEQIKKIRLELGEGLQTIAKNRLLKGIAVGFGAAMLGLGAINVLLPLIVINELNVAETWFAALEFSQASAMIISGIFVTALAARFKATRIAATSLLLLGVLVTFLAPLSALWQLFPLLFAIGLAVTPMQAASATIMQTATDEAMLGRVGSVVGAIIEVAALISMMGAGLLAETLSSRTVFLIGGAIVCSAALLMMWIFRGAESGKSAENTVLQEAL
ncbi:MAG: MFS transporter [Chloroflexota bacterium]